MAGLLRGSGSIVSLQDIAGETLSRRLCGHRNQKRGVAYSLLAKRNLSGWWITKQTAVVMLPIKGA
jgi:hypothetical protein